MTGHEVIIEFELKDEKITNSTDKIISTFESLKSSFSQNVNQTVSKGLQDLARQSNKVSKPLKQIKDHSKASALSIGALATSTIMATKKIIQLTNESANFIGVQTRFNSVFGTSNEELKEAQKWVKEYSEALYLDSKEVMNINSSLALLAKNLGFSNKKATEMSRNLTQLAYDMSAVAGTSLDETFTAIRSGLGGEAEALKKYGVYLNQATLQNTLYANGINRTVSSLNAAERAELAYYQIMKTTAGQQGYLAKTLMSPANAANILRTQFTLLGRSIGNLFLPILMKLLPVVVAVTQALTKMATALASFFGIKIDFSDYGTDIGGVSAGIDGIGESADGASKKMKNMLRDFDDLHVVDFGDDSSSGGGIGGGIGGGGLGLEAQQYADWSKYITDDLEKVKEKLNKIMPYIEAVGIGFLSWKIGSTVLNFLDKLGLIKNLGDALRISAGISLIITGAYLLYKGIKKVIDEKSFTGEAMLLTLFGGTLLSAGTALSFKKIAPLKIGMGLTFAIVGIAAEYKSVKKMLSGDISLATILEATGDAFLIGIATWMLTGSITAGLLATAGILAFNLGIEIGMALKEVDWAGIWNDITSAVEKAWNVVEDFFTEEVPKWWNDNIAPWFTKEKWQELANKAKEGLETKWNEFKEKFKPFQDWWDTKVQPWFTKEKWQELGNKAKQGLETKWNEFKNNFNPFQDFWNTKVAPWFTKEKWQNLVSNAKQAIKNAFSNLDIKIKLPHFTWSSKPATGWIKNVLSALSLPTSLPKLNVSWYAGGGFPDKGDLFIANEREPELIGTMGNKTTVANSVQIIEGIAQASYNGMKRALQEVDFGSGDTLVYVGNKQLTDVVTKQQRMNNKKYGR